MEPGKLIYKTKNDVEIYVFVGSKSPNDFIVKYREPGKHMRTPKHIHLIIDLYLKKAGNRDLTLSLIEYIIQIINQVKPANVFPPRLQIFENEKIEYYSKLNQYGEYTTEFLFVVSELIMIQEKTNYPNGTMNLKVFTNFLKGVDIFSVVSTATFTR
jgi:hypothetical protein